MLARAHCQVATLCECLTIDTVLELGASVYAIKERKGKKERRKLHINKVFFRHGCSRIFVVAKNFSFLSFSLFNHCLRIALYDRLECEVYTRFNKRIKENTNNLCKWISVNGYEIRIYHGLIFK